MSHQGENYFHTDDVETIAFIAEVCNTAIQQGTSLRLYTTAGGLMVKRGQGVWSSVIWSTPDNARDTEAYFEK